jgi:hypothetical protein
MSSERRRGLRIAICFTAAFVVAELLRTDLQLTFIAPLVAGTLAAGLSTSASRLIALPAIAWLLLAIAGVSAEDRCRASEYDWTDACGTSASD